MSPNVINLIVLLCAMTATGVIGFLFARDRYRGETDHQLHILGGEIKRMRRRARNAETAANKLKSEQVRVHRTQKRRNR